MGYRSVKKVPHLRTYEEAHRWWEMTKPIRGRDVDLRPLAERRYADVYSIRKNQNNGAIECVLYRTPVVTFMPDGEIHITNGGWATTSTHMFISEVLYSVYDLCSKAGRTWGRVSDQTFSMGANEVVKLKRNEHWQQLCMVNQQTHYDYRINRKAANNVRRQYKPFRDYLDGFIKLREQEKDNREGTFIGCSFDELAEAYGTQEWQNAGTTYVSLKTHGFNIVSKKSGYYKDSMRTFMSLITDQSEAGYQSFYKAALLLCGYERRLTVAGGNVPPTQWVHAQTTHKLLDTVLLKWHADEVLERYELPAGKMPTSKYVNWIIEEK